MSDTQTVLDAEGNFAASSLLSAGEQTASAKLADALQKEIAEEGEAAAVASAFVAGLVGGEAAVTALAGGAGVLAAASAGVAAGELAAADATAAIATGPAAPIAVAVFALPEILVALWGASSGYGCCGPPPDPTPAVLLGHPVETKAQALAHAIATAKAANADASCNGNSTYEQALGSYATPPKASFQEYAYALIRGAIDNAQLFDCWPLATVNFTKLLAMALDSWNATHFGPPTTTIEIVLGQGALGGAAVLDPYNPLNYAVGQAVPADGSKTIPTGQTSGFTEQQIPTWSGATYKIVKLQVNTGTAIPTSLHLVPIKLQPSSPGASKATLQKQTAPLALLGGFFGFFLGGPPGAILGVLLGGQLGSQVSMPQ